MEYYFDRSGNAYRIDNAKALQRKTKVTVTNSKGEEFEIDAKKADEYKLTADEKRVLVGELEAQIANLRGLLGGCPVIDPVRDWRHEIATRPVFDKGCPVIDPAPPGTIAGTVGLPHIDTSVALVIKRFLDSCPTIDPVRLGSVLGTLAQRELGVRPGTACPVIDPAPWGTVVGTPVLTDARIVEIFRKFLGACPNIDPARLEGVLGNLAAEVNR